jgi:hypothetical protein
VAAYTDLRIGATPVVGGWAELMIEGRGPISLGVAVGGSSPGALVDAVTPATVTSGEVLLALGYEPPSGLPVGAAVTGGVASRWFAQEGELLRQVTTPTAGARFEIGIRPTAWLEISPGVAWAADFREIDVVQRGQGPVPFADWSARFYVAVRPGRRNPAGP